MQLFSLFLLTGMLGGLLTSAAGSFGRRCGVLDLPDTERKFHERATPRTGGLAICGAFFLGLAGFSLFGIWSGSNLLFSRQTAAMCGSAALLCAIGAWDDRHGMQARRKLLWQIIAIVPFALWGRPPEPVTIFGSPIEPQALSVALVLLWLVACSNFINLLDGMDGLAGTLGLIVCLTAGVLAGWRNQPETLAVAIALAGAILGFLWHNWPPARIFMGDCGSLPLGFLVGSLALQASAKKAAGLTLVVPAVLLSVPLVDTSMAILRRKLNGRKIGHGDRGHIHHLLRDRGLSPRQTLLVVGGLSLFAAVGAAWATILDSDLAAALVGIGLVAALVGGRVFGFQETRLLARYLIAVWSLAREFLAALRTRLVALRFESRTAQGELKLWEKIVRRARRMGVQEVEFLYFGTSAEVGPVRLHWEADSSPSDAGWHWQTSGVLLKSIRERAEYRLRGVSRAGQTSTANPELTELLVVLCSFWGPDQARAASRVPAVPRVQDGLQPLLRISDHANAAPILPIEPGRTREAA